MRRARTADEADAWTEAGGEQYCKNTQFLNTLGEAYVEHLSKSGALEWQPSGTAIWPAPWLCNSAPTIRSYSAAADFLERGGWDKEELQFLGDYLAKYAAALADKGLDFKPHDQVEALPAKPENQLGCPPRWRAG